MTQQKFWRDKPLRAVKTRPNLYAIRSWNYMKKYNPTTLLDIGGGRSKDPIYFARKGIAVTVTDISRNRIESIKGYAKKNNLRNLQFIVSDTKKLKIMKNLFDVIYSHLSLHYFDKKLMEIILNRIHAGLKHNGLFFIKCKSIDDPDFGNGTQIDTRTFNVNGHIKSFYDIEYMKEFLNKFNIIKIRRSSSMYEGHKLKSRYIEAIAGR